MHIETKETLVADDGKRFNLFEDIAFNYKNRDHYDSVIGKITGWQASEFGENNGYLVLEDMFINKDVELHGSKKFYFDKITDVRYVYDD